jgi:cyclic nucleotide-binding protein
MGGRLQVIRRVLRNPSLRRVELAFLGFGAAEFGVWVAVLVFAYQHGGTSMAAAIAALQLGPAALLAPAAAELADRRGREVTLAASYWVQAVALLGTGIVFLLGAAPVIGYGWATLAACAVTLTRPAQAALVPQLVRTPSELTAANVTSGWVESASMLVGPAAAGALISVDGAGLAVTVFGALMLVCAFVAGGVDRGVGEAGTRVAHDLEEADAARVGLLDLCVGERPVAVLLGVFFMQFVALGSLDVLVVVLALKQFALGSGGAGYLESMFGAGAVLGGFVAVGLVGHRRLATPLLIAAAVWGASLLVMAGWRSAGAAFVALAVIGASRTVFDVAGRTILHRAVSPRVHARIFGVVEGLEMAGLAVGSLAVPVLVAIGGTAAALVGIGAALMLGSVAAVAALGRIGDGLAAPGELIALVRRSPLFAMLGPPVIEDLARGLVMMELAPGEVVVSEGESGERYFIVADGELRVTIEREEVRTMRQADGFGEIALLRDGIRTATVSAVTPATVYALARAPFLEALGASRQAASAAEMLVAERIGPVPAA